MRLFLKLTWVSSVQFDNKNKDILILGKGPTQGLNTALIAEAEYSINFSISEKRNCLHFNGSNSFLFVYATNIYIYLYIYIIHRQYIDNIYAIYTHIHINIINVYIYIYIYIYKIITDNDLLEKYNEIFEKVRNRIKIIEFNRELVYSQKN